VFVLALLLSSPFADYQKKHALECVGPFQSQGVADELELAGKTYKRDGSRLVIQTPDADDEVRFGVLSSIKDWSEDTKKNVDEFMQWFAIEQIEWLVVNGDIAGDEEELEDILASLGMHKIPMLVSIGNFDSRGSYFRAVSAAAQRFPHIIDQNLVRVVQADDVNIVSMPGYHDRKFLHTGSGCIYAPADVTALLDVAEKLSGPKLLIAHGPPRCGGKQGIDVLAEGGTNAGDPNLTKLLKGGGIYFGIFGHILEASGRAVSGDFATPVAQDTFASKLYVNAGNANALPWGMLDGSTMVGSATVVTIKAGKAKYKHKILRPEVKN